MIAGSWIDLETYYLLKRDVRASYSYITCELGERPAHFNWGSAAGQNIKDTAVGLRIRKNMYKYKPVYVLDRSLNQTAA